MQKLTHNGSDGRSYGGDPNLIHIPDHHRADFGRAIADTVISTMRLLGTLGVGHDAEPYDGDKPVCPGCYMIGLFDALVELAKRDGQSVQELGASMAELFTQLAKDGEYKPTEEMIVVSADTSGPSWDTAPTAQTVDYVKQDYAKYLD